ncbi:hypothetical protein [Undibacterium danionis]|uniref:Tail fiber protein n=1 Tax=Undibacterium danionis TaxID=1812100 RepID=A0ABV6ICY2_9BURK
MANSPVLNGVAGSLIALLDAVLVNGFGLKSADSLVVSGGVATISVSTGHSAVVDSVILVANASPSDLNGEQRVTAVTGNTVSFATSVTNQTATGAITFKIAAAGWTKAFSGTNLAAYKSPDLTATGSYLRVDDTNPRFAKVVGYETMTDINTGSGAFPTTVQMATGLWWSKSQSADTVARPWFFIGDTKSFYTLRAAASANYPTSYEICFFGDIGTFKAGDAYHCTIHGMTSDISSSYASSDHLLNFSATSSTGIYMARSYSTLGSAIPIVKSCPTVTGSTGFYSGDGTTSGFSYPNPVDGGLFTAPIYISESSSSYALRGTMRGLLGVPQRVPLGSFANGDMITAIAGLPNRRFKTFTIGQQMTSTGLYVIDVTGPWA